MTTTTPTTKFQLGVVLERIQSKQYFLIVVQHLLSELRAPQRRRSNTSSTSSCNKSPTSSTPEKARVLTLATLLDEGKKRKRSFTHFEGIPLALIRSSELKAPANRKVVTSRRMRDLERTMGNLCCEHKEDMMSTDSDSGDDSDEDDDIVIIM